jgi:hypothetical protein
MANPADLRARGNAAYQQQNWEEAIAHYVQGLALTERLEEGADLGKERALLHSNRSETLVLLRGTSS